ncbi:MAG: hypothetical protein KDD39_04875 [Bdellovibrionales bacterium]|nr:hypothetical protein [Bdellovibrionales bacterium]
MKRAKRRLQWGWVFFCFSLVCAGGRATTQSGPQCVAEAAAGPLSDKDLDEAQLERFLTTAFNFDTLPKNATVLLATDLPATRADLVGNWEDRLQLVHRWAQTLKKLFREGNVHLVYYPSTGGHNRPLPTKGWVLENLDHAPVFSVEEAETLSEIGSDHSLAQIVLETWFEGAHLVLSLPRYSATAPLSELSVEKGWPFKALSIPGFNSGLLPIFGSDYKKIAERIARLRPLLDEATSAEVSFKIKGAALAQQNVQPNYKIAFDLNGRTSRAEPTIAARWPQPGERALDNAPMGEVWIVPNETRSSLTEGFLPVQKGDELVVYEVKRNRFTKVLTVGAQSQKEAGLILDAGYSNIGELGWGVLSSLGFTPLSPSNDAATLANEKLFLHVANGLSKHLGGTVDGSAFTLMEPVHLDAVYLPAMQPFVSVAEVRLTFSGKPPVTVIRDDRYVIFDEN